MSTRCCCCRGKCVCFMLVYVFVCVINMLSRKLDFQAFCRCVWFAVQVEGLLFLFHNGVPGWTMRHSTTEWIKILCLCCSWRSIRCCCSRSKSFFRSTCFHLELLRQQTCFHLELLTQQTSSLLLPDIFRFECRCRFEEMQRVCHWIQIGAGRTRLVNQHTATATMLFQVLVHPQCLLQQT